MGINQAYLFYLTLPPLRSFPNDTSQLSMGSWQEKLYHILKLHHYNAKATNAKATLINTISISSLISLP